MKIDNLYEPIQAKAASIQPLISELSIVLSSLKRERMDHNKKAKSTTPIIKELNRTNVEIAYYDISQVFRLEKKKRMHTERNI